MNRHDWIENAVDVVAKMPPGRYRIDDLRPAVAEAVGLPAHPNWWGSMVACAVRRRALFRTGHWRACSRKSANGRRVQVYRRGAA